MYVLTCKILGNEKKIVIATDTEVWSAFISLLLSRMANKIQFNSWCTKEKQVSQGQNRYTTMQYYCTSNAIKTVTFSELKCYIQEKSRNNVSTYDDYPER